VTAVTKLIVSFVKPATINKVGKNNTARTSKAGIQESLNDFNFNAWKNQVTVSRDNKKDKE
jgi:hypothetical protein